jgi:hypothetical protein
MQDGTQTKIAAAATNPTENITMKIIVSFLMTSAFLSASTSFNLNVGHAALTPSTLCNPVNVFTPPTPIKCDLPKLQIPTVPTIKCDLPTIAKCDPPVVTKCTPAPVICPQPKVPVIDCPKGPNPTPTSENGPSNATPEPASYALVGAGLVTAGVARKLRGNK